jgi:hypothetical protein
MKYPIGIQNFEKIRRDGYAYVDKTALMYKMVHEGSYYFLSRPRRFGKSLFLSTLEAYFDGQKELFEGLAVSRLETEWLCHPILHLDLNSREYKDEQSLEAEWNRHLEAWEKLYGDEYKDRASEERFIHVINHAYEKTGMRVVILVDEYALHLLQGKLHSSKVSGEKEASSVQKADVITDILQFPEVMGCDHRCQAAFVHVVGKNTLDRLAHDGIQTVESFVTEQILRI